MEPEDESQVEQPEDEETTNGLYCFLNPERECGADCMAYTTLPAESPYLADQQKNCTIIVGVERLGRHTGGVLSLLKKSSQDAARKEQKPPPSPAGA